MTTLLKQMAISKKISKLNFLFISNVTIEKQRFITVSTISAQLQKTEDIQASENPFLNIFGFGFLSFFFHSDSDWEWVYYLLGLQQTTSPNQNQRVYCFSGSAELSRRLKRNKPLDDDVILLLRPDSFRYCFLVQIRGSQWG